MPRRTLVCGVAALALTACRESGRDQLDEAADEVTETRDDPSDYTAVERGETENEFVARRTAAVTGLRARHAFFAAQLALGRAHLGSLWDDVDRQALVVDRLGYFEREVSEGEAAIDSLATATVDQWEPAYDTVENALSQLDTANEDFWIAFTGTGEPPVKTGQELERAPEPQR